MPDKTPEEIAREIVKSITAAVKESHGLPPNIIDLNLEDKMTAKVAAALTRVREEAIEKCAKIADEYDGKGMDSSLHQQGGNAARALADVRDAIRALANSPPALPAPGPGESGDA